VSGSDAGVATGSGAGRRVRDPRIWFSFAVTAVAFWFALRGVDFRQLGRTMAGANLPLLIGLSVPFHVVMMVFRALRWRHLTGGESALGRGLLFRGTAVGFMANNVFPLRMGEVVRSWYLARETGANVAAIFGTVILERAIDTISLLLLAFLVLGVWGAGGEGDLERGALLLVPLAVLPIAGLVLLRVAPDRVVSVALLLLRPFPARISEFVERLLRRFTEGLGALSGGRHLVWITVDSILIWTVFSVLPIWIAFAALGMHLGSAFQTLGAGWMTQAAVGVAVALPSAPGFFGIFHWACKLALVRFGVAPETALAAGTLIHAVMWVTLTSAGLAVLRLRRTGLGEVDSAAAPAPAGKAPPASRR
jgi:uncharacterized protein (TIRG00374 family)